MAQRNYDHRWARDFTTTKSKKPRRVDVSRELRRVLMEWRDQRPLKAFLAGKTSMPMSVCFPRRLERRLR